MRDNSDSEPDCPLPVITIPSYRLHLQVVATVLAPLRFIETLVSLPPVQVLGLVFSLKRRLFFPQGR
jgi:hypothetical protein